MTKQQLETAIDNAWASTYNQDWSQDSSIEIQGTDYVFEYDLYFGESDDDYDAYIEELTSDFEMWGNATVTDHKEN
jgi:hypothetical protein